MWVNRYMRDMGYIKKSNGMTCRVKREEEEEWYIAIFKNKDKNAKPELEYKPGPGTRFFKHKGVSMWAVQR
jgi:hypothetical protein